MVTDGDLVGVATQIIDHRFGSGKGPLGVHHPGLCKETAKELRVFTGKALRRAATMRARNTRLMALTGKRNFPLARAVFQ